MEHCYKDKKYYLLFIDNFNAIETLTEITHPWFPEISTLPIYLKSILFWIVKVLLVCF